jgi:hypothetical protein
MNGKGSESAGRSLQGADWPWECTLLIGFRFPQHRDFHGE